MYHRSLDTVALTGFWATFVALDAVTISGTIYCDNYFEFYFNGELIAKDPIFFTPHQAVEVSFEWDGVSPKTYAIMCQDFATESGYEYVLTAPSLGDGALIAKFDDGTVTSADWKVLVETHGPTEESIENGCDATNLVPCVVEQYEVPSDWMDPSFDTSAWESASVYTLEETTFGLDPILPNCGPGTNPFTQELVVSPIPGFAINYGANVPTLDNPWVYDANQLPSFVNVSDKECLRGRVEFYDETEADFIWSSSLIYDNRILFRYDSSDDSIPTPSPTSSATIPSRELSTRPRIRREWRTLSVDTRIKVADAMRILKTVSTSEGRATYGPLFWNIDDLTMLHACSTNDPRCDQGHYGPQFMTFHRAFLLRLENALLTVDPTVEALPYWDYSRDTASGDCYEQDCYIFSDDFFGDVQGDANESYAVTNGLFAYWPIAEYSAERFGSSSSFDNTCTNKDYFVGMTASTCERCCGVTDCECGDGDVYKTWLRNHDDCTPYVARNPYEVMPIFNTNDLLGTDVDFDACTDATHINSHMDWQNCIEFEQASCMSEMLGMDCETIVNTLITLAPELPVGAILAPVDASDLCASCTLKGFYFEEGNNERVEPQSLHSQAHIRLGRDIFDVTTSPNDISVFSGYHANLDRSHMTWMMNSYDTLAEDTWRYPERQNDWSVRNLDRLSGPWSNYDLVACASEPDKFYEYVPFYQPWLKGTLADDTVNEAYPFDDLWDEQPANGYGYTHAEILYYSDPSRTIYTYDTLAYHYYYDENCSGVRHRCDTDDDCCSGLKCQARSGKRGKCKAIA